jgi:hypothetical protein
VRPSLSIVVTLSLFFAHTNVHAEISDLDCGLGYDSYSGNKKARVIKELACQTVSQKSTYSVLKRIDNYQSLIDMLEIPLNQKIFKNYLVKKIIDDTHINHYTVTIAFYERIDLFKKSSMTKPHINETNSTKIYQKYGDRYITDVMTGAKHLILYHIPTKSQKEYERLKKESGKIKTTAQLRKFLTNVKKRGMRIIVKEWLDKQSDFAYTTDWEKSLSQPLYFSDSIQRLAHPYRYRFKKISQQIDTLGIAEKKKVLNSSIDTLLNALLKLNDSLFYRRYSETFLPLDKKEISNYYSEVKRLKELKSTIYNKKFSMQSVENRESLFNIPQRYSAPLPSSKKQTIPPRNINFKIENFTSKIDPDKELQISFSNEIDLMKRGEMLRISDNLLVNYDDKRYSKSQKQILLDTYVNYPGLYIDQISTTYGNVQYKSMFDRYEKDFNITGEGIIKRGACHYNLNAKKKELQIKCKLYYRPIEMTFKHIEDKEK